MSERPGTVLGALLGAAAAAILTLAVMLVALDGEGLVTLGSSVARALFACVFLLAEPRGIQISSVALVLALVVLASVAAFTRALMGAVHQRRLLRTLVLEPADDPRLHRLAQAAGLRELWIAPADRPAAFCYGLVRPRVVVSRGFVEALELDEQEAAIWHEAHHARRYEPLRCLSARLAAATVVWLPACQDLADRYLLLKELDADRLAVRRTSRQALASALVGVAATPTLAGTVGLGELVEARVDRLLDPAAALPPLWRRSRVLLSALSAAGLALLVAFPARLDLGVCARLRWVLASGGFHGSPRAPVLFALEGLLLALGTIGLCRRLLASSRSRDGQSPVR